MQFSMNCTPFYLAQKMPEYKIYYHHLKFCGQK
uniref:Uncharacterized protein n=1 Tax=Podoviridae sp. ctARy1 TaxID=2825228 RepID=A0A8S5TSL8_9CAUD|nr:MAG TPA: hypothetical protein [Podoviridae sp. ctARy1]